MAQRLPDFLIVGAAKSGTTSLQHYLVNHPEIFLNEKKELRFFSGLENNYVGPDDDIINKIVTLTISEYKRYFKLAKQNQKIGDISPDYLARYRQSIKNIKKYLDDPKIVIILRNPVTRAFSNYIHKRREGRETILSFKEAFDASEKRIENHWVWGWDYKNNGLYFEQVHAYLKNFKNVKIYLFEDLKIDSKTLIRDLYTFLGVDPEFKPNNLNVSYNVSGIIKSKMIDNILKRKSIFKSIFKPLIPHHLQGNFFHKVVGLNLKKLTMLPEDRKYLIDFYKDDIEKLSKLINRNLEHWLK